MANGISRRHFFSERCSGRPAAGRQRAPRKRSTTNRPTKRCTSASVGAGGRALGEGSARPNPRTSSLWRMSIGTAAAEGFERWAKAAKFKDFREMLDKEARIDAVRHHPRPYARHCRAGVPCSLASMSMWRSH